VPEEVRQAQACLASAPRLENAANQTVSDGASALQDALQAYDEGDAARQAAALKVLERSLLAYAAWRDEATPRYVPLVRR